jgi:hypothetical protein
VNTNYSNLDKYNRELNKELKEVKKEAKSLKLTITIVKIKLSKESQKKLIL